VTQRALAAALVLTLASVAGADRVRAAAGPVLTLREAVEQALREGTDAKLAQLEAGQANAALGRAKSVFWPSAGVTSNAGWSNRQDDTIDAINGQGKLKRYPLSSLGSNEPWVSVYIDQVLFDLRQWRGVERTRLESEVAAVQTMQRRETISYAVLQEYVGLLRAQRLAALAAQRVADAEWLDRQTATLLEAGRVLAADREQVALALEEARIEAAARGEEVEEHRAALWRVMSNEPMPPALEVQPDSVPKPLAPAEPAIEQSLSGLPELRILDLRRRMEEASLDAARAEFYPTLSMRGGYFHYGTRRFDAFESELAVGVDLHIPVFDGFRSTNAVEGASEALEAARLRYDSERAGKRARLQELARQLATTAKQPELAERRARLAEERRRLADAALQAQRGSLAESIGARDEAVRARQAAADAYFDRVMLWANYQREAGTLACALVGPEPTAAP
jgi:outer membrane protein